MRLFIRDNMKLSLALTMLIFLNVGFSNPLIIGTAPDNPPFSSFSDNKNNFYGFEIDIMLEICNRIHTPCQFKPIILSNILTLFTEQKLDLVIATVIAPPPNSPDAANFVFSTPYLSSSAQFLVRADSNIHTIQDIRYKTIGVRLGPLFKETLFKDYVLKLYNQQLNVKSYLTMDDLMDGLQNQIVDAIFSNTRVLHYWFIANTNQFRTAAEPFSMGNGYTIMGVKGEEALIAQVNQALDSMQHDGTYIKLYTRYFTLE